MRTTQKRAGREHEPEAVDHHRAEDERDRERERVETPRSPPSRMSATRDDDRPETMSTACQTCDLADADEHLRVDGLRQRVVELPLADLVDQPHHVRLDERPDHARP